MDSPGARSAVGKDVPANSVTDQWKGKGYAVEIDSLGEPVSSQAQCQRWQRQPSTSTVQRSPLSVGCPAVSVPELTISAALKGWAGNRRKMAAPSSAKHKAGLLKQFLPDPSSTNSPFFDMRTLNRASSSTSVAMESGPHLHPLSDYECGMKSKGCDEITWLKLPVRKRAINDFESYRQPFRGFERSSGIEAFSNNRLFQAENNLGFDLQRTAMCERQRGGVAVGLLHRIVVHVGPNQGFKLEHTPHGLIGITNFAADGPVSTSFAKSLERRFNLISRIEIETGAR